MIVYLKDHISNISYTLKTGSGNPDLPIKYCKFRLNSCEPSDNFPVGRYLRSPSPIVRYVALFDDCFDFRFENLENPVG